MIVVDASLAILAFTTPGPANRLLAVESCAAPHLIDAEIANALRSKAARREITDTEASTALAGWVSYGLTRYAMVEFLSRVWDLRHNLSAYDATYVALAESIGCSLATADARLASAPGPMCPIILLST